MIPRSPFASTSDCGNRSTRSPGRSLPSEPGPFLLYCSHVVTIGVDEAGRGPILGPLVMAAVALRPRASARLTRLGVCDSKAFGAGAKAHEQRSALIAPILEAAEAWQLCVVDVAQVDHAVRHGDLNRLEQRCAHSMLARLPVAKKIIADGKRLFAPLRVRWPHLLAVDEAERRHVAVAAASVLAKVRRDELWLRIEGRYRHEFGAVGGMGYVNACTRRFLRAYIERHGAPPPEARRSWPWTFAADLLPKGFDPLADVPTHQLALL
jgi:ribonuclease HII